MLNKKKYLYNPPSVLKKIFNNYQWETINNKILISFDDGPNPSTTEIILKELNHNKLKTIFFCVGENLEKYPSLVNEIIDEGHTIGNHTESHKKLTNMTKTEIYSSIDNVQNYMLDKFDYQIKYFRPPYGRFKPGLKNILDEKKMINVMWSLLTYDYKNDLNIVKFAVDNHLNKDSIIVLHDIDKSKNIILNSIKYILDASYKFEYQIGKPSECLKFFS